MYTDQDDYLSAPFSGGQKVGRDPRSGSKIQVPQQLLNGQGNRQPTQVSSALCIQAFARQMDLPWKGKGANGCVTYTGVM